MRLHAKILLVVLPLAVVPLLVLGWLAYEQLQASGRERAVSQMETLLDQVAAGVRAQSQVARANVKLFSESALMRAYALTADEEERYALVMPSLLRLFRSYMEAYPEYYEIRYLLPDGYEDARATLHPLPNALEEEQDTPFFRALQASRDEVTSRVLRNPDNGEISLQVGRPLWLVDVAREDPLRSRPGLRGYLVVTMDLDFIARAVHQGRVGRSGQLFVVDDSGDILFHGNRALEGGRVGAGLLADIRRHTGLQESFHHADGGEEALYAARRVYDGVSLVARLPESDLDVDGQLLGSKVAGVTLLTVALTVVLLVTAMNLLMVRPLRHLIWAVREMSRGNLRPEMRPHSGDELGELATSFEEMGRNLQASKRKIERLAYHDSLTGLPNRLLFREYLQHMVALARRENSKMAVLFLDLDNFKRVNDTLGHQVGDRLLKAMARRLQSVLRAEDFLVKDDRDSSEVLARLGGDEFIILLPRISGSRDAAKVAGRILAAMKEPFRFDGYELYNGTSIGITLYPDDGTDANDLVKRADAAMYQAKEHGRNNFQFYSASYNQATSEHLSMEGRLRRALERGEMELHYQPQVQAGDGRVAGFEALLRWRDPDRGLVGPDEFIAVAEDSGLIVQLGEWVLQEACRQAAAWQGMGHPGVFVSVNVSTVQLQRQDIPALIRQALAASGLAPGRLEIELSESAFAKIRPETVDGLRELQQAGLVISLDDFGTGYSSLGRLRQLPVDRLKIDHSFVQRIGEEPGDAAVVSAMLFLARSLGLKTTAEGVETRAQAEHLVANGCDLLQGYLFSQPVNAGEVARVLREGVVAAAPSSPLVART